MIQIYPGLELQRVTSTEKVDWMNEESTTASFLLLSDRKMY